VTDVEGEEADIFGREEEIKGNRRGYRLLPTTFCGNIAPSSQSGGYRQSCYRASMVSQATYEVGRSPPQTVYGCHFTYVLYTYEHWYIHANTTFQ